MGRLSLSEDCTFVCITEEMDIRKFSCGDADLNDFFHNEAVLYTRQLLGKTYAFVTKEAPYRIVAMVTLANDSIKATLITSSSRNKIQRRIPNSKRTRSYPAVLIGRLGVSVDFQRTGASVGTQVLEYIASWFVHPTNKTGCRFMVVDAYNTEKVRRFYEKNGFKYLYRTENLEKEANHIPQEEVLESRMMYLDLLGYAE